MLTKGDDFPLHQTPEPVAYAGTDRNFYDRYFFIDGYGPIPRHIAVVTAEILSLFSSYRAPFSYVALLWVVTAY